jgi:hypothetical protein
MRKRINNKLIRSFNPCYDPSEIGIPDKESLSISSWIKKYREQVKNKGDIFWLICRNDFLSDRDLRLFAVWCARESFKLQEVVDQRSIEACNVAERFAMGNATVKELAAAESAAESAARGAAWGAAWDAAWSAAESAAESAAWGAARNAARGAARSAQIDKLLTYFN